jgi:fluoride exporter
MAGFFMLAERRGMNVVTCLWVIVGGAIGTFARYVVATVALPISAMLPWGTIIINIVGCFVIGFVGTLTLAHGRFPFSENLRLFVMVGFCGGFTTFSVFSLQTFDLMRRGAMMEAATNIGISVFACLLAVALGHALASHFNAGARAVAQIAIEKEA